MRIVLGFDGGGTKTECVLMDDAHRVRATVRSGPSNPHRVGCEAALAAIRDAARLALQGAQLRPDDLSAICAGLAGTALPEVAAEMKALLVGAFPALPIRLCTDLDLTLAAVGVFPAMVLVAGTGSAAIGCDAQGHTARVGGHGPLLSDQGSAFDIGHRAALAALREHDRTGSDSPFAQRLLEEVAAPDWPAFRQRAVAAPDEVFPRLFPIVVSAAEASEPPALSILEAAAADLASLVGDLAHRLGLAAQHVPLVKTGGMSGRSPLFDRLLDDRILALLPQVEFCALSMTPAQAAARLALDLPLVPQPAKDSYGRA